MKVIGIDYGLKNIGFAVAETPYATPLPSLKVQSLDDAVYKTLQVLKSANPDHVVVGIPESGPLIEIVDRFILLLHDSISTPITTHQETLTTRDAIAKLRSVKASREKLMNDHSYAACLILEDYLDLHPELVKL